MTNENQIFCDKPRQIDLCITCERRTLHLVNKPFKNMNLNIGTYKPQTNKAHSHCVGWVAYPIKDDS